jgi:hypothetical protein
MPVPGRRARTGSWTVRLTFPPLDRLVAVEEPDLPVVVAADVCEPETVGLPCLQLDRAGLQLS